MKPALPSGARQARWRIPPGQRTLPRGFKASGGSSGAGSGAPSYPFTSPNRDPVIQSSRACTMSSWVRPIQFQGEAQWAAHGGVGADVCGVHAEDGEATSQVDADEPSGRR